MDATWIQSWAHAFAPQDPILACARDEGQLVGLVPLQQVVDSSRGVRVAVLQSLTNNESYRFDFLTAPGRVDVLQELWRALCDARRWDLIRVQHVPADSPTIAAARTIAVELGWRCLVRQTFLTPWRPLSRTTSWDEGLTRRFKSNLHRRERRLAEAGEIGFSVVTTGRALRQALEAFYRLEAKGWKGQSGTAVVQRPAVKRFYDRLVGQERAGIWIPILTVGGCPIAVHVVRVWDRTMFGLKTAYEPAYARFGPGQLLTSRLIRYGLDRGMEVLDFLADNASWKADWAQDFRPHCELVLFAPSLAGRAAYWLLHGLQDQLKRVPGMFRLARWVRPASPAQVRSRR
ncbi:MAG: hypothetical protein AUI15_41070 [Actinobacteria bacterium 13_2_20CM_2_66_6]|nr:MAG: hypothetical protein AUI15_41070 [Actinobacteria bacterium 13_2_20CM_2_66_6]